MGSLVSLARVHFSHSDGGNLLMLMGATPDLLKDIDWISSVTTLNTAGHDSGDIRLWDLDTASNTTLTGHTNSVTSLEIAMTRRNEEFLISGKT